MLDDKNIVLMTFEIKAKQFIAWFCCALCRIDLVPCYCLHFNLRILVSAQLYIKCYQQNDSFPTRRQTPPANSETTVQCVFILIGIYYMVVHWHIMCSIEHLQYFTSVLLGTLNACFNYKLQHVLASTLYSCVWYYHVQGRIGSKLCPLLGRAHTR